MAPEARSQGRRSQAPSSGPSTARGPRPPALKGTKGVPSPSPLGRRSRNPRQRPTPSPGIAPHQARQSRRRHRRPRSANPGQSATASGAPSRPSAGGEKPPEGCRSPHSPAASRGGGGPGAEKEGRPSGRHEAGGAPRPEEASSQARGGEQQKPLQADRGAGQREAGRNRGRRRDRAPSLASLGSVGAPGKSSRAAPLGGVRFEPAPRPPVSARRGAEAPEGASDPPCPERGLPGAPGGGSRRSCGRDQSGRFSGSAATKPPPPPPRPAESPSPPLQEARPPGAVGRRRRAGDVFSAAPGAARLGSGDKVAEPAAPALRSEAPPARSASRAGRKRCPLTGPRPPRRGRRLAGLPASPAR